MNRYLPAIELPFQNIAAILSTAKTFGFKLHKHSLLTPVYGYPQKLSDVLLRLYGHRTQEQECERKDLFHKSKICILRRLEEISNTQKRGTAIPHLSLEVVGNLGYRYSDSSPR